MIGIITVNYNQYKITEDFLNSLSKIKDNKKAAVFIADLSTEKKSLKFNRFPFSVFIQKASNKGYAFGVNQGIKYFLKQGLDKFCVVNNDVLFEKNFLIETEKSFKNVDIFGGKIYYAPGFEYHKNRYQKEDLGKVFWYAGGLMDWNNVYTIHRGVDEVDCGQYDKFQETEFITGCLICFNKKVVNKVGFWDESYFLYYEDADFCQRAKKAGFKLFYNPKIIIWHKNAQSTGGSGSFLHLKHQRKNRIKFGLKYAPFRTKIHLVKNLILELLKPFR